MHNIHTHAGATLQEKGKERLSQQTLDGERGREGEDEDSMSHGRLDEKEKEEEGDLEDFLPP